jgi:hypothetical protein
MFAMDNLAEAFRVLTVKNPAVPVCITCCNIKIYVFL